MRIRLYVLALLTVLGCQTSDGESCETDDECASESCYSGHCAGSECSEDDDCEEGWDCREIDPNWAEVIGTEIGNVFTGGDDEAEGSYMCRPRCGSCPPNQSCGQSDEYCSYASP